MKLRDAEAEDVEWINLAGERDNWMAVLKTVMNFWVSKDQRKL